MTANRRRGEIAAILDGREHRLCLTLGALAELEAAFGADDMTALAERFASGRLSARDLMRLLGAGLRGGGHAVSDDDIAAMKAEGGIAGIAAIVTELLEVTFGATPGDRPAPPTPQQTDRDHFPGTS